MLCSSLDITTVRRRVQKAGEGCIAIEGVVTISCIACRLAVRRYPNGIAGLESIIRGWVGCPLCGRREVCIKLRICQVKTHNEQ